MTLQKFLETFKTSNIKQNEPLSTYAYTQTGGPADLLVFPKDKEELKAMVNVARRLSLPCTVLGNSSNVIVRDGGIEGIVFMLSDMANVTVTETLIYAEAGVSIIEVSHVALEKCLTGLEFACGIPGSTGGAVFMNAGAYDGEMSQVVQWVDVITQDGEFERLTPADLDFSYRYSTIQNNHAIVVGVELSLQHGEYSKIQEKMASFTALRTEKQPLEYPSCGSVFKRPEGYFTGQLVQQAGLQGFTVGGAQVSKKHGGFIVNIGGATAADYLAVIEHVQKTVLEKYKVTLETEVRVIGRT